MLAVQQNSHTNNGDNNSKNRQNKNDDKKKTNFSKKNYFQKNQSFNFRNKSSKSAQPGQFNSNLQNNDTQFQPKIRSQNTTKANQSSSITDNSTAISLLTPEELALEGVIGSFKSSMPSNPKNQGTRSLPKFLLYQPPTLDASDFLNIDQWDRKNQAEMEQLEQNSSDLTSLYEDFQKMRENERSTMEKKGLVDNENIRRSLENAIIFKGSCHDMCPVFERIRRSVENDVRTFEKDDQTNKISKFKAIKAFSRPAAGQPPPLPSDVRPPQILVETLEYITKNILGSLPEAQSFLWDRTRSIRQDFTYQNYLGPEAADCNEKIVRIHILTLHIMAENQAEYSQQQELEQMNKALKTLSELYTEYRSRGVTAPNEAEFRAYYMLSQIRDPELEREIETLPIELLNDERIQLVLQLRNLISMNIIERGFQASENVLNAFTTFFDMINNKKIPVLMSYLLEIHLNEIRFYALKSMKKAIHSKAKPYPLELIQNLLAFNEKYDLVQFCDYYGIIMTKLEDGSDGIDILSLKHSSHIIPDQKPFRQSFSNKLNSVVGSYESLINSGQSNTELIRFKDILSSFRQPFLNKTLASSSVFSATSLNAQPSNQTSQIFPPSTSTTSAFPFQVSHPPTIEQPTHQQLEAEKGQKEELDRKQEELRIQQEAEQNELKLKEIENEKARKQELELQKLKKSMLEKQELKKQKKIQLINSLGTLFKDDIINRVVQREFKKTVYPLVESKREAKEQKEKLIDAFGDGLYEAFVNELVYFQSLVILSDIFRERQLKKKMIKKIGVVSKNCKQEIDLKKRKREELLDVIENFGVPRIVKKKKIRNLSYSEISNISTSTSIGSIPTPKPTKNKVDLNPFDFTSLITKLSKGSHKGYHILLYVEDSIISRLFNKKFGLNKDSKSYYNNEKEIINVQKINQINSNYFNHVNLLVFNLIEMRNFESKKLELKELLQGIQLNNNYKFEILVIYWELDKNQGDNLLDYNKRDILKELNIPKNDNILKVDFIKVDSSLNLYEIEYYLKTIGDTTLSAKGLFNERYNMNNPIKKEINDNKLNFEKSKINRINNSLKVNYPSQFDVIEDKYIRKYKPHIEASKKYKSLPKLLSDQNKNVSINSSSISSKIKIDVYSTPRPKSSELLQTPSYYDSSSISTFSNVTFETKEKEDNVIKKPTYAEVASLSLKKDSKPTDKKDDEIIPRSIKELRDLAKKVKERHSKK